MKLFDFINQMTPNEQDDYAKRAGTTGNYLRAHVKHARKMARPDLMKGLSEASDGAVSMLEVIEHFYQDEKANAA